MTTPLGKLANLVATAELAGMESEVLDEAREALAILKVWQKMAREAVVLTDWLAPDGASIEERKANGRLICQAKNLLSVCRNIIDPDKIIDLEAIQNAARAAIKKTEGK